jgi:hypothetical protein
MNKQVLRTLVSFSDHVLLTYELYGIRKNRKVIEEYINSNATELEMWCEGCWHKLKNPTFSDDTEYRMLPQRRLHGEIVFEPLLGDNYFYCSHDCVRLTKWQDTSQDRSLVIKGNCFRTREEALRVYHKIWGPDNE